MHFIHIQGFKISILFSWLLEQAGDQHLAGRRRPGSDLQRGAHYYTKRVQYIFFPQLLEFWVNRLDSLAVYFYTLQTIAVG